MTFELSKHKDYAQAPMRSIKDAEIDVILKITRDLKHKNQNRVEDFPAFTAALRQNCRLWVALAADVANSQNALSADVRAKIFYLCEFTQVQTRRVLSEGLTAEALIEINVSILRGLSKSRGLE